MTPDTHDGSQWDRVAAELRACRETQQRAWGDIDNTTLGRFLAGEVSAEEQQQIENALDALPELRKLTDLVRDVLGEAETAASEPVSVPYGPLVLPFPQPQQRTNRPAMASARAEQTTTSPRQRKPWYRESRWRPRIGLAAAACLLLVLGVALPQPLGSTMPEDAGLSLISSTALADRRPPFDAPGAFLPEAIETQNTIQKDAERSKRESAERFLQARMNISLQHLQAQGKQQEAQLLASQYAHNLTRQALLYQRKGDLTRAEPPLQEACRLCTKTFGWEAPQTVRTRNSLAVVYEVALNAASENPLPRSAPTHKISALPVQPDVPPLLALRPPVSSSAPVRSESGYAPAAYGLAGRSVGDAGSSQLSAFALRACITHRSQQEVKASIVPVLTQALREAKNASERQRLTRALGQLGSAAADAVPILLDTYRRASDASERVVVLQTLGQIGPAARQAAPLLVDSLHSDNADIRNYAARALARLGPIPRSYGKERDK